MYPGPDPRIQRFHFQLQDLELGGPKVTGTCRVSKFLAARMGLLCGGSSGLGCSHWFSLKGLVVFLTPCTPTPPADQTDPERAD